MPLNLQISLRSKLNANKLICNQGAWAVNCTNKSLSREREFQKGVVYLEIAVSRGSQQNSVTLFGQFVKWHGYSSTFSSVVCFSQNQFELFLVWIFGSFGNALPFSKKMYYSVPWFGCIVCGRRSISEARLSG